MDKSSSTAKWLLYGDVVKGEPSLTGRGRRSRDEKGNQGVGDILFTNILHLFSIYFFFSITLVRSPYFITYFVYFFYPHPRPTTSTHDPRPATFSYTHNLVIDGNSKIAFSRMLPRNKNAPWRQTTVWRHGAHHRIYTSKDESCEFSAR